MLIMLTEIIALNLRKKYREINKEKINIWQRQYYENHKEELNFQHKEYYKNHMEEMKFYQKQHHNALRLEILHYYSKDSMQCACCGESHIEFLTIDHINNDGKKHREKIGSNNIYGWLKTHNFPIGFQVLCWNCNHCKGGFGECYHKNLRFKPKFNYHTKNKIKIVSYYSSGTNKCACCGEDILYFLAIDHINGGGNKHYKELIEKGTTLDQYLINNNFPPGYRILCHNCNSSLGAYGYCPHNNIIPTEVGYKYTEIDEEMFL